MIKRINVSFVLLLLLLPLCHFSAGHACVKDTNGSRGLIISNAAALFYSGISGNKVSYENFPDSEALLQQRGSEQVRSLFASIEDGLASGEAGKISPAFGSQTYLSLSTGNSGYYSQSQAFYILQDFFRIYKPVGFHFRTINDASDNPYAAGTFRYESKGVYGSAQVFVTLKQFGNSWKISQITIN